MSIIQDSKHEKMFFESQVTNQKSEDKIYNIYKRELLINKYVQVLKKHRLTEKNLRLLDIGCGLGLDSIILERNGFIVTGIDISTKSIEHAKELNKIYGCTVKYEALNFFDINNYDYFGRYDVIYCFGFLHHVTDDIYCTMEIIHSLLKENGYFLSIEPNPYSLLQFLAYKIAMLSNKYFPIEFIRRNFTTNEMPISYKKIVKGHNGFKLIDYSIMDFDYSNGLKKYFVVHTVLPKKIKGNTQVLLLQKIK